ncbi:MAG: 1,4-beta-xylanase [Bacteroides sp. SM23_62_1]|nr:MAG: 1,4-beta-xylanase [Bacteroides sp. SM23_62_1]
MDSNNNWPVVNYQESGEGLKDYYRDYFPIGVAVTPYNIKGPESEFILKHFISITPENVMKPERIHPEKKRFNWKPADEIVNFAQANGLKVRGHVLCWHKQTPDWFFKDESGNSVSKEILLMRLKEHITEVVTRYKGKIYAWDVINEAISNDNTEYYQPSLWYDICGEDFIFKAFEFAHEADPDALLFYNDYNTTNPVKRDKIYSMLKQLLNANIPVHGVGMQGHWSVYGPSETEIRKAIELYSSLGLEVQITELDVSIYRPEQNRRNMQPDESDEFTPELEQKQLEQYKMFFTTFRDYKEFITGVTFWNISDRYSWLDNYPVRGRKNYPSLFDKDWKPKRVYEEVINF